MQLYSLNACSFWHCILAFWTRLLNTFINVNHWLDIATIKYQLVIYLVHVNVNSSLYFVDCSKDFKSWISATLRQRFGHISRGPSALLVNQSNNLSWVQLLDGKTFQNRVLKHFNVAHYFFSNPQVLHENIS